MVIFITENEIKKNERRLKKMVGKWVKPENVAKERSDGFKKDPSRDRKKTGDVFMKAPEKKK